MRLRGSDVTWQELDGHVVLLDLRASVYLEINASGSVLFPLLVEGTTSSALVETLCLEFELEPSQAEKDVDAFIQMLRRKNLLEER